MSDPEVTHRSEHFLVLKAEHWSLLENLEQALKPFECATVYLSGASYVTLSSLPPVIKGLLKSIQTSAFDNTHVQSFQEGTSSQNDNEDETRDICHILREEILRFFGEQPLPKNTNPLQCWKSNEGRFPSLAFLAKSYLCVPATSTPSERLFSSAGNIVSKKRASLRQNMWTCWRSYTITLKLEFSDLAHEMDTAVLCTLNMLHYYTLHDAEVSFCFTCLRELALEASFQCTTKVLPLLIVKTHLFQFKSRVMLCLKLLHKLN